MLETIDLSKQLDKQEYKTRRDPLRLQLAALQRRARELKIPVMIVFEGWDAAGKGTLINRLILPLDPRGFKVHPINQPTEEERYRPFLWRFWIKTPAKGRIAVFDRSWYGRVLVERVEGFATEAAWRRAYREINSFERQLRDFGTVIVKFWVHISREEQLKRFEERQDSGYKSWKLTDEDWRNRAKWPEYERAVRDMLLKTSTITAPWTVVEGNNKWWARVKALTTVVETLSRELDYKPRDPLDKNKKKSS